VLHVREAFEPMAELLADYRHRGLRGVFHSFAGTAEQYRTLRAIGDFRFGIGGVVTYKNSVVAAAVAEMAVADLVLETDAPYLPPVPYRGKRNESAHLPLIAEKIAAIQGRSPEEVARITTINAVELFRL
jgi:TatD DNase family protein